MRNFAFLLLVSALTISLTNCGPKAFTKGDYDDVNRENLLNDQWSETDMQQNVKALAESLLKHPKVATVDINKPLLVMVTKLQNKTSEHIDTQSVMDMVRVNLMNSGKMQFVDKEARDDVSEEYKYQGSEMVKKETAKGPGNQIGADYILNGRLDSIVQEVGNKKTIYYKLTLNFTDLKTNVIVWSDNKEIRKKYKKQSIGM